MILRELVSFLKTKNKPSSRSATADFEPLGEDIIPNDDTRNKKLRRKFTKIDDNNHWLLKIVLNRLRLCHFDTVDISLPDQLYKVIYLGNTLTSWSKDESCLQKQLSILWKSHNQHQKHVISMHLTVSRDGLKVTTKEHGLTEYWSNRITYCCNPTNYPKLFCWVYRHECKRLRHELRCHAALCSSSIMAKTIEQQLRASLSLAFADFKRDKVLKQKVRLSLGSDQNLGSLPKRKILLCTGGFNYKPPLERSKSAPKLTIIEELISEDEHDDHATNIIKSDHLFNRMHTSPIISIKENTEIEKVINDGIDLDNLSDESGYVELSDTNSIKSSSEIQDSNDGDKCSSSI